MNHKFKLNATIASRRFAADIRLPATADGSVILRILRAASRRLRIPLRFFTPRISPRENTSPSSDEIPKVPESTSKNTDADSFDLGGRWLEL